MPSLSYSLCLVWVSGPSHTCNVFFESEYVFVVLKLLSSHLLVKVLPPSPTEST
jgi:hypothetical protein